jgi:hypothetical protein
VNTARFHLAAFLRGRGIDPLTVSPEQIEDLLLYDHVTLTEADALLKEFCPKSWRVDPYIAPAPQIIPDFPPEEEEEADDPTESEWAAYHERLRAAWRQMEERKGGTACLAA